MDNANTKLAELEVACPAADQLGRGNAAGQLPGVDEWAAGR